MTDHAALPVKGYTAQPSDNVAFVNENKELEERVLRRLDQMRATPEFDQRMVSLAVTAVQDAMSDTYTPTSEFNGMKAGRRRQALVVIEGRRINHGPLFPNKDIVGRVTLEGKRGARYDGFVHRSGLITVLN